jgi:hypothetical protein
MRVLNLLLIGCTSLALGGQSAGRPKQAGKPPFVLSITSRRVFTDNTLVEIKARVTNTSSHDINASTGTSKASLTVTITMFGTRTGSHSH